MTAAIGKRRIDVEVPIQLREGLDAQLKTSGGTLVSLVERYLQEGLARDQGQVLEQQSLPVLREMVRVEIQRALAQQHLEFREDLQAITEAMKTLGRRSDDRLAGLLVRAVREASLSRRLGYQTLLELAGEAAALESYQRVREETGKDLARSSLQAGLVD